MRESFHFHLLFRLQFACIRQFCTNFFYLVRIRLYCLLQCSGDGRILLSALQLLVALINLCGETIIFYKKNREENCATTCAENFRRSAFTCKISSSSFSFLARTSVFSLLNLRKNWVNTIGTDTDRQVSCSSIMHTYRSAMASERE